MFRRKKNDHSIGLRNSRLGHRFDGGLLSRQRCRWVRGLTGSGTNHDARTIGDLPRPGQAKPFTLYFLIEESGEIRYF
jgi:hypothetical protein